MKYALIGFVAAILALWAALYPFHRSTVTREGRLRFDDELILSYRVTSVGGALGDVRYEVFAEQQGQRSKIFDGTDASAFTIRKGGPNLILLRFCRGTVEHLSAIYGTDLKTVTVQPILYCNS